MSQAGTTRHCRLAVAGETPSTTADPEPWEVRSSTKATVLWIRFGKPRERLIQCQHVPPAFAAGASSTAPKVSCRAPQ